MILCSQSASWPHRHGAVLPMVCDLLIVLISLGPAIVLAWAYNKWYGVLHAVYRYVSPFRLKLSVLGERGDLSWVSYFQSS